MSSEEVVWRGFPIARGLRWEGERGFCTTPTPMPVGTTVLLKGEGEPRTMHVAHTVEGDPAGMWLAPGPGPSAPAVPATARAAAAPAPSAAAPVDEAPKAAGGGRDEPTTGPGQPSRKKKKKR